MNYFLSDDQLEMREIAKRIAEEKMRPLSEKYDEEGIFPWDIVEVMRQSDLFAILVPEEYDGISGKVTDLGAVTEELCAVDAGIALAFGATGLGMYPITIAGSEEQKKKYLPQIAAGEQLAAFALTEANAGSDAGAIETTARREGDHYILNGTKQWITNGGEAGIYTVFAMTDKTKGARGCSCFIVEKGTPGFSFGKKENKMGIRASATRELIFEDCAVPEANLIGREGTGFITAMKVLTNPAPWWGRRLWASPAVPLKRPSDIPAKGSSSASRSRVSKPCSSCWRTWPPRSKQPGPWCGRPRK